LDVTNVDQVDIRPLAGLRNLRGLRVESSGAGIDFAWFPQLEIFAGDWHSDHRNLAYCRELRTLRIRRFKPGSKDLSDFVHVTRLETLEVVQTDIGSVDGVEDLEDLRYLDIAYAPKLTSLDALGGGKSEIRELMLENAKSIPSYRPLASMRRLRRLRLSDCAPMPNLKWTAGMNRLDFLAFVNTNVENGDLSPLLELPALRYVGTMDKKHYSHKADQINELLEQRHPATAKS
jgi:hypothetical protein